VVRRRVHITEIPLHWAVETKAARAAREAIDAYQYKDEVAAFTNPALIAGLKKTLEMILSKSK